MKLWQILLVCALLPACTPDVPQPPPGMPLDREHMPTDPDKALTRISSDTPAAIQ
jgi:hypothetical protein